MIVDIAPSTPAFPSEAIESTKIPPHDTLDPIFPPSIPLNAAQKCPSEVLDQVFALVSHHTLEFALDGLISEERASSHLALLLPLTHVCRGWWLSAVRLIYRTVCIVNRIGQMDSLLKYSKRCLSLVQHFAVLWNRQPWSVYLLNRLTSLWHRWNAFSSRPTKCNQFLINVVLPQGTSIRPRSTPHPVHHRSISLANENHPRRRTIRPFLDRTHQISLERKCHIPRFSPHHPSLVRESRCLVPRSAIRSSRSSHQSARRYTLRNSTWVADDFRKALISKRSFTRYQIYNKSDSTSSAQLIAQSRASEPPSLSLVSRRLF